METLSTKQIKKSILFKKNTQFTIKESGKGILIRNIEFRLPPESKKFLMDFEIQIISKPEKTIKIKGMEISFLNGFPSRVFNYGERGVSSFLKDSLGDGMLAYKIQISIAEEFHNNNVFPEITNEYLGPISFSYKNTKVAIKNMINFSDYSSKTEIITGTLTLQNESQGEQSAEFSISEPKPDYLFDILEDGFLEDSKIKTLFEAFFPNTEDAIFNVANELAQKMEPINTKIPTIVYDD